MATQTLLTVEAFAALPDDGNRHELDEGELRTVPPPGAEHQLIQGRLYDLLRDGLGRTANWRVVMEPACVLQPEPPIIRVPDLGLAPREWALQARAGNYFAGAPAIAMEILSSSDTLEAVFGKVQQYLLAGSQTVLLLLPSLKQVQVHRSGQPIAVLSAGETLVLDHPLLQIPVQAIFELD